MYSVVEGVFIYVVIALCQQYLAVLLCWLPWPTLDILPVKLWL